ncbi:MAG: hypothetical protein V1899_03130 [Planctomycetota bacterium]
MTNDDFTIHLPRPHERQREFIDSTAKRRIIRAGRRGGKTVGAAIIAIKAFLDHRRVLYATPTADQIERFWYEVTSALAAPIDAKALYKNETEHVIEVPRTLNRIRAKTAWNANTLRGDYGDLLILDEFQLMDEDAWGVVGAPMLLDNNGDAVFIYTPPSLRTSSASKAHDKRHAAKLFKRAQENTTGRWQAFHFASHENPHISKEALIDITRDMTRLAYEQEILAEDKEDSPGALWKRADIEANRVTRAPELEHIVVGVDPSGSKAGSGDECGIVANGSARIGDAIHIYTLEDASLQASPDVWARAAITLYYKLKANYIVAEQNFGGEMVRTVINQVDANVPVKLVSASRGKAIRAEPISAICEQGREHHVGTFFYLEDEQCQWQPGDPSPGRMDAHVWSCTELIGEQYQNFVGRAR